MRETIKTIWAANKAAIIASAITSVVCVAVLGALAAGFLTLFLTLQYPDARVENIQQEALQILPFGVRNVFEEESRVIKAVELSNPAVVAIVVTKDVPIIERYYEQYSPFGDDPFLRQFFGDEFGFRIPLERQRGTQRREVGGGSGFFVSSDGLIVTNRHVVGDPDAEYTVFTNDGNKHTARILAKDQTLDIAILKIDGANFPFLAFGNSDLLKQGQTAIAIGNALGEFRNSVSVGVISGLSRSIVAGDAAGRVEYFEDVIQTDAAINLGNSGGPLLNLSGNVIGVNVAVQRGAENIGFAIPSNVVRRIVESVKKYGEIVMPYLGVHYIRITERVRQENNLPVNYGVLIWRGALGYEQTVMPGSPAEKAGIQGGDIILEINGVRLDQRRSLASLIRQKQVGETVRLTILRRGEEKELRATLERAPQDL